MFRRIAIKNFRSIEDATVDLAPFTVVVGPNGSGKSNFADALVFMRDLGIDAENAVSGRGGMSSVSRWSKTRPYDTTIDLRIARSRDELDGECIHHLIKIGSSGDNKWHVKAESIRLPRSGKASLEIDRRGRTASGFGDGDLEIGDTASIMVFARSIPMSNPMIRRPLLGVRRYRLAPDAMRQPQLVSETSRLTEDGANIATAVRHLHEGKGFESVLSTMQRIIPGLIDVRSVTAGRHVMLEFEQRQKGGAATFTASEMSDGALRALGVIIAAQQMQKDELLIIEEPEANIHAGAAALIFDVLKSASRRGSVLITTHSPELLDAASDEDIIVCRYADGITRLGPLDQAQRNLVREGLFKLAELMRTEPLRIEGDLPEAASA
jgi:type I restriction enzyme M protein